MVIGPFSNNLFSCPVAVSPLNSVPKPDTTEQQIILDLSWPVRSSVNDGIPSGLYLAQEFALVYPTMDLIADRVAALGSGCLLFKRDLRRAYRQFPVDPYDYPLLEYSWNGHYYFDVVLPMGLRTAAMACQSSTNAVSYILSCAGCQVANYYQSDNKELLTTLTDGIALAMNCLHDMNSTRRQSMKKDLQRLCRFMQRHNSPIIVRILIWRPV